MEPIRLSYHGKSHYNALVPTGWTQADAYIKEQPGLFEDRAIATYGKDHCDEDTEGKQQKPM
jgi:hypothetical protein